jgi:hypothetical protein
MFFNNGVNKMSTLVTLSRADAKRKVTILLSNVLMLEPILGEAARRGRKKPVIGTSITLVGGVVVNVKETPAAIRRAVGSAEAAPAPTPVEEDSEEDSEEDDYL